MARRPMKNDIPPKTAKKSTVFQGNGPSRPHSSFVTANSRENGAPHTGLTRNRSKPSGGYGSGGRPVTSVD